MEILNYMENRVGELETNTTSAKQQLEEALNEVELLKSGLAKIEAELARIGYHLNRIDDGIYEIVKTEYSPENPVVWYEGITPINNQYYRLPDGKVYVWMGEWIEWD